VIVTYRNNASDVWHQFAYLATKTVPGRLFLAFLLIFPMAGPVVFFFSTPPGSKAEHFAVIAFLPAIGGTYALLAFSTMFSIYLSAWITPKTTITLEPERCYMVGLLSLKTPWRGFQRMVNEPDFLLFLGGQRIVFIPKHAFVGRAEADRFFHTALTYWHEAKGTVPPPPPAPLDLSGVWPPAPQTTAAQEPGTAETH